MSDAPDEVRVAYAYSATEQMKAIMSDPTRRRMMLVLWAIIPAAPAWHYIRSAWRGETIDVGLALAFVPATALLLMSGLYFGKRLQLSRLSSQNPDGTEMVRRFSSLGFAISNDAAMIPWGLITEVAETKLAFLISDASSTSQVVLPKRAMSSEQVGQLRAILSREFASRPKELKLLPNRQARLAQP